MLRSFSSRPRLAILLAILTLALLSFIWWGWPDPPVPDSHETPQPVIREVLGSEEGCLSCHGAMRGFAPAHRPEAIGCSPCHGGDPHATTLEAAHIDLILAPGNLNTVYQTCGAANCHGDLAARLENSLMTTLSGVITVDRFVFGETTNLNDTAHVRTLGNSAADQHLRHLCASCHLGAEKEHPAPVGEKSRGGGCIACHLSYDKAALAALQNYKDGGPLQVHPAIDLQVTNDHCFGCHSRSGRISTNYEGWHETQLTAAEVEGLSGFRQLADKRIFRFVAADVHHTAGLECIDCHNARELMGDGNRYAHEEEAVRTTCGDCHFNTPPPTLSYEALDIESKKILALRALPGAGQRFVVNQGGIPLINVQLDSTGAFFLLSKNSGARHPLPAPAETCTRGNAHNALTCGACHTGWAPQCVGCHNAFDPDATAFDLLDRQNTRGKWEEYLGEFFAEAPTLGVVEALDTNGTPIREIKTFIPGMIMTIDKSDFPGEYAGEAKTFHRLFAPTAPHTTAAKGRSCRSCHNDPLALGYGRGALNLVEEGWNMRWSFYPEYVSSEHDGLPQDAWTGFLKEPNGIAATRSHARPFSIAEQQRILTVGACLTCHAPESTVMQKGLEDFESVWQERTAACRTPVF